MTFLDDVSTALDRCQSNYGQHRDPDVLEEVLRQSGRSGPSEAVERALEAATTNYGENVSETVLADELESAGWS